MSINPEKADLLALPPIKLGHTRNSSSGERMIAAKNKRNFAGFERLKNKVSALDAGRSDFLQIFGVRRAFFFLLGDGDRNVAGVFDNVADGF